MTQKLKKLLWPLSFILGGVLVGLVYYYLIGCISGSCPITSNPFSSMLYMALFGWLLSYILRKECNGSCNT